MKILVTGITGFLGEHVARACHEHRHEVIGFIRNLKINADYYNFPIELRYGDLRDDNALKKAVQGVEAIIHCAANTEMGAFANPNQDLLNVQVVKRMIDITIEMKLHRFVFISSANTIHSGGINNPGSETCRLLTSTALLNYINTKIAAEQILLNAVEQKSFPGIIINPTFMIGPGRKNSSSNRLFYFALRNKILFYPSGSKNVVDVRDVADACVNALMEGRTGERYLLSNTNLTFKSIFKKTNENSDSSTWFFQLPFILSVFMGFVGSFLELIFGRPMALNHKTVKVIHKNYYYSNHKAKVDLGFMTRPVEESIRDTVRSIQLNS